MFNIMIQNKGSIEALNSALAIHSANIANMSVTGYKALDISFESILNQVVSGGSAANTFANKGGTNPMQLGGGSAIGDVSVDFSQGSFVASQTIDLGINGNGLFIASSDNGETFRYSRAGDFTVDANGNLVTSSGFQVYGLDAANNLVAITGLQGNSANYSWDANGALLFNGNQTGYRIALTTFPNASGLTQADGTTFIQSLASGDATAAVASGGAAGTIQAGQLEQSNVFYLGETIDSLEIQQSISANLSVVKMASDIISSFIQKLG